MRVRWEAKVAEGSNSAMRSEVLYCGYLRNTGKRTGVALVRKPLNFGSK